MTPAAFLLALQLGDTAFPYGRFSHSYGLEELLTCDPEIGEAALAELVESMLLEVVAPLDGVALAEAHRLAGMGDVDGLLALDVAVTARKITPSSRHASTACGRRLAALLLVLTEAKTAVDFAAHVGARSSDGNLAVVEGVLTRALSIGVKEAILIELRGTSAALLSAALRLGRISATRAQVVSASLVPAICDALEVALSVAVADMRAVGPEFDLAAMRHTRREGRLFAT